MAVQILLDVPALERLIGNDKEMEVKVKESVISNFLNHNFRPLAEDPYFKEQIDRLRQAISDTVKSEAEKQIGSIKEEWKSYYKTNTLVLRPEFKEKLTELIEIEVDKLVKAIVADKIAKITASLDIEGRVLRTVEDKIKKWSAEAIDKKAKEMLQAAVKSV